MSHDNSPSSTNSVYKDSISMESPSYKILKKYAIRRMKQTLNQQLNILANTNQCDNFDLYKDEKFSHNVFSWSFDEYLLRRQLEDCEWIDMLMRSLSSECLAKQKTVVDIKEIQRYASFIFEGFFEEASDNQDDWEIRVLKPLRDIIRYNHIMESLKSDQAILLTELNNLSESFILENVVAGFKLQKSEKRLTYLSDQFEESEVFHPIEFRYAQGWQKAKNEQNIHKSDFVPWNIKNDIEKLQERTAVEMECGDSVDDAYNSEIQQYTNRLSQLQERYDTEFEIIDNQNNYLIAEIVKLQESRKFYQSEMKRFRQEIEQLLEKEKLERQEAELKRQFDEAEALALLEAKKLKKRKKIGSTKSKKR